MTAALESVAQTGKGSTIRVRYLRLLICEVVLLCFEVGESQVIMCGNRVRVELHCLTEALDRLRILMGAVQVDPDSHERAGRSRIDRNRLVEIFLGSTSGRLPLLARLSHQEQRLRVVRKLSQDEMEVAGGLFKHVLTQALLAGKEVDLLDRLHKPAAARLIVVRGAAWDEPTADGRLGVGDVGDDRCGNGPAAARRPARTYAMEH